MFAQTDRHFQGTNLVIKDGKKFFLQLRNTFLNNASLKLGVMTDRQTIFKAQI